ncbi:hypothetical protein AAGW05_11285 [Arthrobacter sp. LAPM80]|uniref:alpha/beta hydrolase family esterase n=1 Tax=Arthrobacter sp. LAPM80 TaxID=3141788 RepID=UPI00398B6BEE
MRQEILVGGRDRSFHVVSAGTAAVTPGAVVLVLHGSSQTGRTIRRFSGNSFDQLATGGRVAVVYPDGLKKAWNHNKPSVESTDDVAFIEALADHFHALHGPIPVIVVGFSNGGQLAIRLIHEIPDKLHGAAIVGATLPRPGGLAFADKLQPFPVMLVHGTHDMVVTYGGEGWFGSLFGRPRGPSAPETAQYFAARNNITAAPAHTILPHRRESGRTSVTLTRYEQKGRLPVVLYTVAGGGHVVPNRQRKAFFFFAGRTTQDMDTVEALAEFFPALSP